MKNKNNININEIIFIFKILNFNSRTGPYEWRSPVAKATIRRDKIFEDGYEQLNSLGILLNYFLKS